MPKTTQLVLSLDSKPGVLAKLARTLADASVNMTALCAPETAGRGKIRLLVSDLARAKEALKIAKYRFSEEQAVTVLLENRPGTFVYTARSSPDKHVPCYARRYARGGPNTAQNHPPPANEGKKNPSAS